MGAMMAKRRQKKTLKKIADKKQEELNPENAMILPPVVDKEFLDKKKKKK